jgi:GT2 family glycosyltransferase
MEQAMLRIRAATTPPGSTRELIALAPGRAIQIVATEGASGVARRLRESLSADKSGSQALDPFSNPLENRMDQPIPDSARQYILLDDNFDSIDLAAAKYSIVILSYNNINYTRLCLNSILAESGDSNYEVIIVDNASSDGTPRFLQEAASKNPSIKLILNPKNLGFAHGNNQGAQAATGDFLIFLNNDTVVTPGWLSALAKYLHLPQVGMVGPVTNTSGNESRIEISYRNLSEMRVFAKNYAQLHAGKAFEIPMLAFLCVALRRTVFEEVGLLDEQFGLGMFEDDDYAIRVHMKGYQIICAQDVFIHHWGSASFSRLPDKLFYQLFNENRRKFEKKWGSKWTPYRLRKKTPTIYHY